MDRLTAFNQKVKWKLWASTLPSITAIPLLLRESLSLSHWLQPRWKCNHKAVIPFRQASTTTKTDHVTQHTNDSTDPLAAPSHTYSQRVSPSIPHWVYVSHSSPPLNSDLGFGKIVCTSSPREREREREKAVTLSDWIPKGVGVSHLLWKLGNLIDSFPRPDYLLDFYFSYSFGRPLSPSLPPPPDGLRNNFYMEASLHFFVISSSILYVFFYSFSFDDGTCYAPNVEDWINFFFFFSSGIYTMMDDRLWIEREPRRPLL